MENQKFPKKISKSFDYSFAVNQDGLYAIAITASCKSGRQIGDRGGEDLRVEIDGQKLREVPAKARPQYKDIPPAWNGTGLKGLKKTVVFLLWLNKGDHLIKFTPDDGAVIEIEPKIEFIPDTTSVVFNFESQAEDGDRRPWYTFALINLSLKTFSADITVKWRGVDSDDVKLIIDSIVKKNNLTAFHRDWLWSANIFKKLFQRERQKKSFEENLSPGVHYLEFWADRLPTLHQVELDLGKISFPKPKYNDPPKIAEGFNERYVLKDEAFNDKDSMSESEIQKFLDKYHEVKEKNHISKLTFDGQPVTYWLRKAAEEYNISPKVLLTKLQSEQGLIKGEFSVDPKQKQLDYAMNVGKLDTGVTLSGFSGFVNQIINAAYYFRKHYDEAESNNLTWTIQKSFAERDFTKIEVKCINASSYSLYRFTPWLYEGGRLVYNVYQEFFGIDDLGGKIRSDQVGRIILSKLLVATGCLIFIIGLLTAINYLITRSHPLFSWQNVVIIADNIQLLTKVNIISQKHLTVADGLYCGTPFYKTYQGEAQLFFIKNKEVVGSYNLTNPDLMFKDFVSEELIYYQPWDIDGDGKKQEFVIQEYVGCNGNLFSFIKVTKNLNKLEKIPVIHQDQFRNFVLYVGHSKNNFKVEAGLIRVEYYDNTQGQWFRDWYEYDKMEEALKWVKGEVAWLSQYPRLLAVQPSDLNKK